MTTFLDVLVQALSQAGAYNPADQVAPIAVLWPDKEAQWAPLLPELRERLPLLTLGAYAPAERTGPAYYLRCMLGRTLPEDLLPPEAVPIVYLPGVSRQELRAIAECPRSLQPLVELQYRGALWAHKNGRDWTVSGFIQNSDDGLGVAVAGDNATREALRRALPVLAHEPVARLRQEAPLRAPFLDELLNPDAVRRLLSWMNDPAGYRDLLAADEWTAFCLLCRRSYGFHPEADGDLVAGRLLGQQAAGWQPVWQRFAEAPEGYPHLPDLLRRARPPRGMFEAFCEYWPQDNEALEDKLRAALLGLSGRSPAETRAALLALEAEHGKRRDWVWARLGRAPLASALASLVRLAETTATALAGVNVTAIAEAYTTLGWQADAAVLDARAVVATTEDMAAIREPLLSLYRPWLDGAARALQRAVLGNPAANYVARPMDAPAAGTCLVFCDALRFDVAQRLSTMLEQRGLASTTGWALAALPAVTATAKPALAPLEGQIAGAPDTLTPVVKASGAPVVAEGLRGLMRQAGYQVLLGEATGDPSGLGWVEIGDLDQYGHGQGWRMAGQIDAELGTMAQRIAALLGAGWGQVKVVTDHGWLLLPGGLPKAELPLALTVIRKGRCAVLTEAARPDQPIVPWHWDAAVRIAVPPGIACYEAGKEYEHGGLSPQECIVPVLTVTAASGPTSLHIGIKSVTWRGLRCQVELAEGGAGLVADLRTRPADQSSSVALAPKAFDAKGIVSLVVPNDELIGTTATIVVISDDGLMCAQMHTTIGG